MIGQCSPALARGAVYHLSSLLKYVKDEAMCKQGRAFVYDVGDSAVIATRIDQVYPMKEHRDAWDYLKAPRSSHGRVAVESDL